MRSAIAGTAALLLWTAAALDLGTRAPAPRRARPEPARTHQAEAERREEAPTPAPPEEPPVDAPEDRWEPDSLEGRVQTLLVGGSDVETISALAESYRELVVSNSPLAGSVRWTLQSAAMDASEEVRAVAVAGLLCEEDRHRALFAVTFDTEPSPEVRAELVRALAKRPGFLRTQVRRERDTNVRRFAAEMCRMALLPEDAGWLREIGANEPDIEVRLAIRDSVRVLTSR